MKITLDKERNLFYNMRAIAFIEKKLGKPLAKFDLDNLSMEESAVFVQAGLITEDKEIANKTADEIMDMIDSGSNYIDVMELAGEAFGKYFNRAKSKNYQRAQAKK